MQGIELRIKGKVQGVGFRPFVWLLANQYKLNGDVNNDFIYENVYVDDLFKPTPFIYKHLCGEYFTSSAFGLVKMAQLIKNNRFSNHFYRKYHATNPLRKVLFHNHYHNKTHSLILLGKC